MNRRRMILLAVAWVTVAVWCVGPCVQQGFAAGSLKGRVVTGDGEPVPSATVISSSGSFNGWGETSAEGTFELKERAAFLSVRHPEFKPVILAFGERQDQVEVQMEPADNSVRLLPNCNSLGLDRIQLIGGGLKVRAPTRGYRGPVYGDHDAHWYVDFAKGETLHIVSGPWWHSGLPLEDWLVQSMRFKYRGWVSGDVHGLDISGETTDGKKWRWVGPLMQDALSYHDVYGPAAAFFDSIIDAACYGPITRE